MTTVAQRGSAVIAALLAAVAAPCLLGPVYTAVMVLLAPLWMAVLTAQKAGWMGCVMLAGLGVFTLVPMEMSLSLPWWLAVPAGLYLASCAGYALLQPRLRGVRAAFWWGGWMLSVTVLALVLGSVYYGGPLTTGLADTLYAAVEQLPLLKRPRVLVQLYQAGLAGLEGAQKDVFIASVRLVGPAGIAPEIQQQLMWSFRSTMERYLPMLLPEAVGSGMLLIAAVALLLRDWALRRLGEAGDLPRFGQWYMQRPLFYMCGALLALGFVLYGRAGSALGMMGMLCHGAGYWAMALQGLACICFKMQESGASARKCVLICGLLTVFASIVPVAVGTFDNLLDVRHIREENAGYDNDNDA